MILGSILNNTGSFFFILVICIFKVLSFICLLCVDYECVCAGLWMEWYVFRGQRKNFKSQCSSATGSWDWTQVMWCFYPVSHLTRPLFAFLNLTHHLGWWILVQELFHAIRNFKAGLLSKFNIYIKGLWEVWAFPRILLTLMPQCQDVVREGVMWGIGQHHSSLNWGIWGKEWPSFSCDLRSTVCGIGFDPGALVTNRSKSEKQPEMRPWNNTSYAHTDSCV